MGVVYQVGEYSMLAGSGEQGMPSGRVQCAGRIWWAWYAKWESTVCWQDLVSGVCQVGEYSMLAGSGERGMPSGRVQYAGRIW